MAINIVNRFGTNCTTPKKNRSIEWIAIHYTAGVTSKPGSAVGLASWYKDPAAVASSDFIVDDTTIVQYNEDIKNRYTWGVGGNMYQKTTSLAGQYYGICKNSNCINIEVCSNKTDRKRLLASDKDWFFTDAEVDLTVELTKYLMKKFNIDADHVVMHHQVTGKPCPAMWTHDESELKHWYAFKARIADKSVADVAAPKPESNKTAKYEVVVPIKGYSNAADATADVNPVSDVAVGSYYIYKEALGAYNITKTPGTPGSWIDPNDNKKAEDKTPEPDDEPETKLQCVEYKNVVMRVSTSSSEKLVKGATHFTYGEFAEPGKETIVVNKELVRGLEMIYDYLHLSKMTIEKGNATEVPYENGYTRSKHRNGFGADVCCYDSSGKAIPSDIICCVAQKMGFNGIGKIDDVTTHLDIRKENDMYYFDASIIKPLDTNFFVYSKITQGDIDKYAVGEKDEPTKILGKSVLTADELASFVKSYNPEFPYEIAEEFITIGEIYGIRGDIALCQSCVETGYFKYEGSAVTPDQHNYCGLGVTSNGMKGCEFDTVEDGVEAQIQHLYAYATNKEIPNGRQLLDPRFTYVQRGCAPTWDDLNHRWCTSDIYGKTIVKIYNTAKEMYR